MSRTHFEIDSYGDTCQLCGNAMYWSTSHYGYCEKCFRRLGTKADKQKSAIVKAFLEEHTKRIRAEEAFLRSKGHDPHKVNCYRADKILSKLYSCK